MKEFNRINTIIVKVLFSLSFVLTSKADLIHTNQIRAEGLQADRDFVTNNAALNNTLNIKPVNLNDNPYLKSLNNQIQMEQAQNEARREAESQAIEDKWAQESYNNHYKALKGQKNQVFSFNAWAREYYPQLRKQALNGDAVAMYTYAWLLSPLDDERETWLRSAAEAGHIGAVSALGWRFFDKSVQMHQPSSIYHEGIHDEKESILAFKLGAVEYWTRAADKDDPSALAMCALIYWAGGERDEKRFNITQNRQKALHYLDRLEKIGALTLHDIIAPYLYEPSFFQLMMGIPHPIIENAYYLRDEGGKAMDETQNWIIRYSDYSEDGMYPKLANYEHSSEYLHLEMIKREAYPTLWHTRQAAMKGDKKAIERLIQWGQNRYIETYLDPAAEDYNQWMILCNLGPVGNTYGFPNKPKPHEKNLVNPYKPGFYMNDRELQYWSARLKE